MTVRHTSPSVSAVTQGEDERWREVLRRAGLAIQGHPVGVFESDSAGHLRELVASVEPGLPAVATRELERALRRWNVTRRAGRRWVAGRLGHGRWCIAPVRAEPPAPPPAGVERRGSERLALELAGLSLGLLEHSGASAGAARAVADTWRRSQARLALLVQQVPAMLWTVDRELRITSSSGAALTSLGLEPEQTVGLSLLELHERRLSSDEALAAHRRALAGESVRYLAPFAGRWFEAHVEPLHDERGAIVGVVGIALDVSDRERALEDARRARRDLEDFFENSLVGMHAAAADGTILIANQAEMDMLGYRREEYVGHNIAEFHADPQVAEDTLRRLRAGESIRSLEARLRHKDGSIRDVLISTNVLIEDGRFVHTRCVSRDITERKKAEELALHGALHDPLTDLPNRAYFVERVGQALARAQRDVGYRFAVLFLDLDDFKLVNDSLGHAAGDGLLAEIARRLPTCVRPGDVVARLGGDEFTVLLDDITGRPDAERAARRIHRCFAQPVVVETRELVVSVSIGVALSEPGYDAPEELLRDADIAMYHAKAQGRSRSEVFDVVMRDWAQTRFGLETDLRGALDRAEFRLVFQPIVDLKTGRVHSLEALLRWHHPTRGVIGPGDFIPIAEQTGLIVPIGRWVLFEACWHARRWRHAFPAAGPLRVTVNLSAKQLDHQRVVDDVREALKEATLDPRMLRLEITESVLMESVEASATILDELRRLQVGVLMDDFGTGYSSLSYLPRLPLQAIKVDRSFVHRMGGRRTDLEIVRSIVELARNLGLGVVAEGVETAAQRDRLLAFGCELGQGFHFAPPLEPAEVSALLESPVLPGGKPRSPSPQRP
jgi:diguanylate cyclase (GGDEF)-like protein/PAS domain S-box-containing protein